MSDGKFMNYLSKSLFEEALSLYELWHVRLSVRRRNFPDPRSICDIIATGR